MIDIGTRVRSSWSHVLVGTIIGFGMIQNPWNDKLEMHYFIKLDERADTAQESGAKYIAVNVVAWHVGRTIPLDSLP